MKTILFCYHGVGWSRSSRGFPQTRVWVQCTVQPACQRRATKNAARGLAHSIYEREAPGHEQTLTHFPLPFLHRSQRLQTLYLTSPEPHERQCRHVGDASDWDMSGGRPKVTEEKTPEAPKIHPPLTWIMSETTSLVSTRDGQ